MLAWSMLPSGAQAQGLQPALGPDGGIGDLRQQFQRAYQTQPAATIPGWTISPSLDLAGAWTSNVNSNGSGNSKSGFYTTVMPGLVAQGSTQYVTGGIYLAPSLSYYPTAPNENQIGGNGSANVNVTVIPETLFVRLTGLSSESSRSGGIGQNGTTPIAEQDKLQTSSYSISPLLQHRFGGVGLAELGYNFSQIITAGGNPAVSSPFTAPVQNGTTTTNGAHAAFTTGEDLGRLSLSALANYQTFNGVGVLSNAHRYVETIDVGYALSRLIALVGELGHENLHYAGLTPYSVNDTIWNGGFRLTPDPDSTLTVRYGHVDGANGLSVDANYALTASIRLYARYSKGLSTQQEGLQEELATSDLNALGQPVDRVTGVPLLTTNNFSGAQGSLYRTDLFSGGLVALEDRNTYSLNVVSQNNTLVSADTVGAPNASTSTSGGLTWGRDLNPNWRSTTTIAYGYRTGTTGNVKTTGDTVTFSVGLTWLISETLTARALYTLNVNNNNNGTPNTQTEPTANTVLVGLHKTF